MSDVANQIISIVLESLGSVMVALICLGLRHLIAWIKSKTASEKTKTALDDLHNCIEEGIFYIEQELVRAYKSEGKWDAEAKAAVKAECVNYVEKILNTATKDFLSMDPVERAKLISSKIEAEIGKLHEQAKPEV